MAAAGNGHTSFIIFIESNLIRPVAANNGNAAVFRMALLIRFMAAEYRIIAHADFKVLTVVASRTRIFCIAACSRIGRRIRRFCNVNICIAIDSDIAAANTASNLVFNCVNSTV